MKILFVAIAILGFVILLYSIKLTIKSLLAKNIAEFPLDTTTNLIELNKPGLYSICFLGVAFIESKGNFNAQLKDENGNLVPLKNAFPNVRFWKNWRINIEYHQFKIEETGKYTLTFNNLNDLKAMDSMLSFKRMFQEKTDPRFIKILVKKLYPQKREFFQFLVWYLASTH